MNIKILVQDFLRFHNAYLLFASFILLSMCDTSMITLLRIREQGALNTQRFKECSNNFLEGKALTEQLNALENPRDIFKIIPEAYRYSIASYENNSLMRVIVPALVKKPVHFKNAFLESCLYYMPRAYSMGLECYVRALMIAAITAGADPNLEVKNSASEKIYRPIAYISDKEDDFDYAQALIKRGATVNVRVHNNRTDAIDTEPLLFIVKTPLLAELLIEHGAALADINRVSGKTLLHEVVEEQCIEPDLLSLYIRKYQCDVNVSMPVDGTPLETLVKKAHYYDRFYQDKAVTIPLFKKKLEILLDHGAVYVSVLAELEKKEDSHMRNVEKIARNVLLQHHAYMQAERLRNINLE